MVVDLPLLIGNGAVGTYLFTGGAAVTQKLVGLGRAGVRHQVILGQKPYHLHGGCAGLGHGLRNVFGSLADAGEEDTCRGRFYRTQLCVGLS